MSVTVDTRADTGPRLAGLYYPTVDQLESPNGWNMNIGWGSGSTMQVATSTALRSTDRKNFQYDLLQGLFESMINQIPSYKFDFEELIGNQGPQGPAGPRGLPGLPGIGTSYVPFERFPSWGYTPAPRIHHFHDVGTTDHVWNVLVIWSELATCQTFGGDIKAVGWAKIVNESASDRIITLWIKTYEYDEYHVGDPADWAAAGTARGEMSETVEAGMTKTVRLETAFSLPKDILQYITLFGRLDNYDPLLSAEANHYGISGVGVFPRQY